MTYRTRFALGIAFMSIIAVPAFLFVTSNLFLVFKLFM